MALGIATILYLTVGGMMIVGIGVAVLIVSGKSIFFDFYRRLMPKGTDVFIVNSNRQISQHYKVPKDNQFRLGDKIYITNPDKLLSLSEDMKQEVKKKLKDKKKNLEKAMIKIQRKIEVAKLERDKLSDIPANQGVRANFEAQIVGLQNKVDVLQSKMDDKEQLYYNQRRGAFFYIEGDPIPKDFHEWYTEMDSITIDNVIARSMTKDPKAVRDMEKQIKTMKLFIIGALIASAIGAVIALSIKTDVSQILQQIGGTIQV